MKKFLCFILLLTLLPIGCFAFTACKNSYNLKDFYESYKKIDNECPHLILDPIIDTYAASSNSFKLNIDYIQSPTLSGLVEDTTTEYYYLKYFYQQLLDDSLAPLYFFGEKISNSKKVSDSETKELFEKLKDLENSYKDIDYYTGALISSLKSVNEESVNLSYLKKLFERYEVAIVKAGALSAVINNIYFNKLISNSNIDYSAKTYDQLGDADLTTISMNLRSRMYYYKSVYANIYTQLYIRDANLADNLIYESMPLPVYQPYTYISGVNELQTKPIDNLRNSKQDIYNNIVSLYTIQNNFGEAYKQFNTATNKIVYNNINPNTSSQTDLNYAKIIEQFANGIAVDSCEILNNLIDLLYL
jgi:hypothetical protein